MAYTNKLIGLVGAGALAAGMLTGPGSAQAATGACEDNIGYRISSPAGYRETGGNTVVIGLTAPARTVTFFAGEGSGCVFEPGDHWSVTSPYFHAQGTYDGTPGSLTDSVHVKVPASNSEAGVHLAVVTLDDVTGSDNDTQGTQGLYLKRRTIWRDFNVFRELPTPACGTVTGSTLHAEGQLFRASWTRDTYRPYKHRHVRLLVHPGSGPVAPGHTADDTADITVDTDVTGAKGWARFAFKPPYDAKYFAHYGGNSHAGHSDSSLDFVNCSA
jgi:hypothetical protein